MGTLPKHPSSATVYVMAKVLVENGGLIPLGSPDETPQVKACLDAGLLRRRNTSAWGEPWTEIEPQGWVPNHEGWERIAELSWDEIGRKAYAYRTMRVTM